MSKPAKRRLIAEVGDYDVCYNPEVTNVIAFEGEGWEVFSATARVGIFRSLESAEAHAKKLAGAQGVTDAELHNCL